MCYPRSWTLLILVIIVISCAWKTGFLSWPPRCSTVRATASIRLNLNLASSALPITRPRNIFNSTSSVGKIADKNRKKYRDTVSRYMLRLYHLRPEHDVVRALEPTHISSPVTGGGRIIEFSIPIVNYQETLETAELLGTAGTIFRVRSMDEMMSRQTREQMTRSRRDETWRAFNVTSAVATRNGNLVRLHVHGRISYRTRNDGPILLLSYRKPKRRKRYRRSTSMNQDDREENLRWDDDGTRRLMRRKNSCKKRPLYVDFSLIAYDKWVVAPPGYEAYQCAGKCYYPFGDHLSPTKHAIVQTLVHGALQGTEGINGNKPVGRACCVPTRLAPTSLLYLDATGTLTYQYGYEDMVVAECGCR
ncbi:growth/differentiation factor 2-like [Polistes fuscatus]|uniref:growth/differentiation factor 2-like n=1 Tax=Polistes fuscatus TaxID=30207 RepID=UPI001CA85EC1|nr:growth/differentiation factor 2-like [Polistes fuscatus]